MTQAYYTERLLPKHIERMKSFEQKNRPTSSVYLQEDNDGSHSTRSGDNVAKQKKDEAGLQLLFQPAKSPDLNPSEGINNIIKERLRYFL